MNRIRPHLSFSLAASAGVWLVARLRGAVESAQGFFRPSFFRPSFFRPSVSRGVPQPSATSLAVCSGALGLLVLIFVAAVPDAFGQQLTPRLYSTTELIERLNSPRFQERAEATKELVALGESSLRPLAKSFFQSSPEQAWRIRQIVREVCISGDEATFFKAAAMLRLLFGGQLGGEEVEQLQQAWMNSKSDRAIEQLKARGAEVTIVSNPGEDWNDLLVVMNRGEDRTDARSSGKDSKPEREPPAPPLDAEQLLAAVDSILVGSLTENRKYALGLSSEEAQAPSAAEAEPEASVQREIAGFPQQRVVVVGGNQVLINSRTGYFYPEYANRVAFGPEWEGETKDFLNLVAVKGINSVELKGLALSKEQLQAVSRVAALQHVRLDGCELTAESLEGLKSLAGVGNLSLANLTITPDLEEVFSEFTSLQSLRLENLTFQSGTFWKQFRSAQALFYLELKNLTLTGDDLQEIGKLPALQSLLLTWTKFPLAEYREFLAQHPTLRPQVVNKAFLGVRGGLTLVDQDRGPCVISEVIADSAAANAGLQVDDVVQQVNDQQVETFRELVMYVSNFNPGDKIKVKVLRDGKPLELEVTLAERPPNAQ
ncbi:MAG: PDZ domain-containing protein [Planctomycetota bacterium]